MLQTATAFAYVYLFPILCTTTIYNVIRLNVHEIKVYISNTILFHQPSPTQPKNKTNLARSQTPIKWHYYILTIGNNYFSYHRAVGPPFFEWSELWKDHVRVGLHWHSCMSIQRANTQIVWHTSGQLKTRFNIHLAIHFNTHSDILKAYK